MYETDIKLGERYRDEQTGIEGIAVSLTFFQFGCERVTLEWMDGKTLNMESFDAPRLVNLSTGEKAESDRTGGPMRGNSHVRPTGAKR